MVELCRQKVINLTKKILANNSMYYVILNNVVSNISRRFFKITLGRSNWNINWHYATTDRTIETEKR